MHFGVVVHAITVLAVIVIVEYTGCPRWITATYIVVDQVSMSSHTVVVGMCSRRSYSQPFYSCDF